MKHFLCWMIALGVSATLLPGRAGALTVYVSNEKDNSISVIDADKMALRTMPRGRWPTATVAVTAILSASITLMELSFPLET